MNKERHLVNQRGTKTKAIRDLLLNGRKATSRQNMFLLRLRKGQQQTILTVMIVVTQRRRIIKVTENQAKLTIRKRKRILENRKRLSKISHKKTSMTY